MAASPEKRIDAKSNLNQIKSQLYESTTPSSGNSTPDIIEEQKFENDLDYLLTNKRMEIMRNKLNLFLRNMTRS